MTIVEIPGSISNGRRSSSHLLLKGLLLAFILFPYGVFPLLISAIFLNSIAMLGAIIYICGQGFPRLHGLGYFLWAVLVWSLFAALSEYQFSVVVSQANHMWQFALMVVFIAPTLRSIHPLVEIISSHHTRWLLLVSTVFSFTNSFWAIGRVHEFTPNSLMLFLSLIFGTKPGLRTLFIAFVFAVVFSYAERASPILTILIITILRLFSVQSFITKICAIVIALGPIFIYTSLDVGQLIDLLGQDHNTYIRAEFIRGAFSELSQHFLGGMGFGPDYRPANFAYQTGHVLLTNLEMLSNVSNHHSLFDTAYRLGLPIGTLFFWQVFLRPRLTDDRLATTLVWVLALGLSVNAWFENQMQLPNVAIIVSYLSTLPTFTEKKHV